MGGDSFLVTANILDFMFIGTLRLFLSTRAANLSIFATRPQPAEQSSSLKLQPAFEPLFGRQIATNKIINKIMAKMMFYSAMAARLVASRAATVLAFSNAIRSSSVQGVSISLTKNIRTYQIQCEWKDQQFSNS